MEQRERALKRDGYSCQYCGNKDDVHVHHIVPYRISKDNSLNNLISLCRSCHTTEDMAFLKIQKEEGVEING